MGAMIDAITKPVISSPLKPGTTISSSPVSSRGGTGSDSSSPSSTSVSCSVKEKENIAENERISPIVTRLRVDDDMKKKS
ncbi:hypothetical protein L6452_34570 [Arctium lappa]|uniref:Uncharacterized protein n=1 Tax=Arctium lappa TaxID=4217 RepID=A0ACB8YJ60_ARCLA|nr:hypothetical protein L6452_34570 [Arctium lappa]